MLEQLESNGDFEYEFLDDCVRRLDDGIMDAVGDYSGEMGHFPVFLFEQFEQSVDYASAKENIVKYRDAARSTFECADYMTQEGDLHGFYFGRDVNPFLYPQYYYSMMLVVGVSCVLLQCRGMARSSNGQYPVTPAWYDPRFQITPWTALSMRAFLLEPGNYGMANIASLQDALR